MLDQTHLILIYKIFIKKVSAQIRNCKLFILTYLCLTKKLYFRIKSLKIGNIITIVAALFAIIQRDTLSAGLAGLSISISLTVCVLYSKYIDQFNDLKRCVFCKISSNLNWFVRTSSEFEANITAVERINEYFHIKKEVNLCLFYLKFDLIII